MCACVYVCVGVVSVHVCVGDGECVSVCRWVSVWVHMCVHIVLEVCQACRVGSVEWCMGAEANLRVGCGI